MTTKTGIGRRTFLRQTLAISLGFTGLRSSFSAKASAQNSPVGFGPLIPDPDGILDLPEGFSYQIISTMGDEMTDGFLVPGDPDGMATFPGPDGKTILVRNHELEDNEASKSPFGPRSERFSQVDPSLVYDVRTGTTPAFAGTSNLLYDTRTQTLEAQWLSLTGTLRNCAGGPTPWNTWITCEETVQNQYIVRDRVIFAEDHGYNFEVPATAEMKLTPPVALKEMGRFNHEAIAVDPVSGIVYETEDRGDGLIYRYIPNTPGKMSDGGRLQALVARDQSSLDTRNHSSTNVSVGEKIAVGWIDIEDVESPNDDLRYQGFSNGAARFSRGEGMWYGQNTVFFACTDGGSARSGQIWKYIPSPVEGTPEEENNPGTLELFIEPNNSSLLQNADNITVSPWGDLIICEDGSGEDFLVGVTPDGQLYKFGRNALNSSEFCGATFSPDGTTLFVNIQQPGYTLAITGPFHQTSKIADWRSYGI